MWAALTSSKISGHSSVCQPCSRMSGQTPVAMSWSMARTTSTWTPCLSMIAALASTRPWVLLGSGDLFRVQLMKRARRPAKSYVVSFMCASPFEERWGVGNQVRSSHELTVLLDVQQCGTGRREQGGDGMVEVGDGTGGQARGAAEPRELGPVRVDQRGLPDRE